MDSQLFFSLQARFFFPGVKEVNLGKIWQVFQSKGQPGGFSQVSHSVNYN